jgi:hypothetical protein
MGDLLGSLIQREPKADNIVCHWGGMLQWLVGRLRGGSAAKCLRATTRSFRRDPAFHPATTRSFLLLFSSFSSLSCSIVKSLLLQCGLVREGVEFCFAFFFLFMRCQYVISGQKTLPFCLIRIEVILLSLTKVSSVETITVSVC